jgi:hypothetical protein
MTTTLNDRVRFEVRKAIRWRRSAAALRKAEKRYHELDGLARALGRDTVLGGAAEARVQVAMKKLLRARKRVREPFQRRTV